MDGKFRRFYFTVRDHKLAKDRKTDAIFYSDLKSGLKALPSFLFNRCMPYLSRLPIVEDCFQGNIYHYQNRNYLKFRNILETTSKKICVTYVDVDQYHLTFYIRLIKPLTLAKAKIKINYALRKYFGKMPDGVIMKLKRRSCQLLIPIDLIENN